MSANIPHLDGSSFQSAVAAAQPTLVDFWAPWCGPCKAIAPLLEEISVEVAGKASIAKVNVDDNRELATQFGIRAIPTLFVFKSGQVVETIVGMVSKEELKSKLLAHA